MCNSSLLNFVVPANIDTSEVVSLYVKGGTSAISTWLGTFLLLYYHLFASGNDRTKLGINHYFNTRALMIRNPKAVLAVIFMDLRRRFENAWNTGSSDVSDATSHIKGVKVSELYLRTPGNCAK